MDIIFYLLHFSGESEAKSVCQHVQLFGGNPPHNAGPLFVEQAGVWNTSLAFPDTEVVVQREAYSINEESSLVPIRPRIVLPGFRILVGTARFDDSIWDLPNEPCEVVARIRFETPATPESVEILKSRPGKDWHIFNIEPLPAGIDFSYLRRIGTITGAIAPTQPVLIDTQRYQSQIDTLRDQIVALRSALEQQTTNQPQVIEQTITELDFYLALLQSRFVNVRFLESLVENTVRPVLFLTLDIVVKGIAFDIIKHATDLASDVIH